MQMPGRSFSNGNKYRYGFNGKENDKDAGEGIQDYGMRIYDNRLGKFLSVDPLAKQYPWYSPYHFAGCNPIRNLDLDGGEPLDYIDNWQSKRVDYTGTGIQSNYWTRMAPNNQYDRLGLYNFNAVYDKVSNQYWFVHTDVAGKYYYWKHNPGAEQTRFIVSNKTGGSNGQWQIFETQNSRQARLGGEVANILSAGFATAIVAVPGIVAALPIAADAGLTMLARATIFAYRYARTITTLGTLGTGLADPSGQSGNAIAAVESYFISGLLSKSGNYVGGKLGFIGQSGSSRVLDLGGLAVENGKTLTIDAAAYITGLTNEEAAGEMGRQGINAIKQIFTDYARSNGYEKLILNYQRSQGSSSKNPGSSISFTIDLLTQ
jgi:RHS repeat-associated protein